MATSLRDVQNSQNGESSIAPTDSSFSFPTNLNPEIVKDTQVYIIFRLVKKGQRRLRIDGICDGALNPKTKRRERIWLLRGAESIWQSELSELLKDKEYRNKNRVSLLFEDGVCRVPVFEERMLEYARANIHNVGKNRTGSGKYDYYEYDAGEEQKFRLEKQMSKIKTIQAVSTMKEEPMKKLASFLGIVFYDDLGQPKGEDGIRSELLLKADTQPETVNKYMDSQEVEIAYMVRKAIIEGKIDLTAQTGNALWAGGKGFICKIPTARKAYEYLTEFAMTNSTEGKQFKEQLETMIT